MTRSVFLASIAALTSIALALPGSVTAGERRPVAPIVGAPATVNGSSYTPALTCLAMQRAWTDGAAPRIAVGRIADLTGRVDLQTGARVSQAGALFAVTALTRAGVPVVERLDNSVAEIELNYARQHLLSDTPEQAGISADNFRPILAGQIAGSRYYIVGGVSELNYNIGSSGVEAQVGGSSTGDVRGFIGSSSYVLNVAVDLRLVDTRSQEVLQSVSFQKQVVGVDRGIGLNGTAGSVGGVLTGGNSAMEPIQAAVRTVIDRGVFELLSGLQVQGAGDACLASTEFAGPGPAGNARYRRPGDPS
jgi:curli production assembly/transport component CsgG/holdfast attachment protein HfaB